jgi:hypothetical protein
VSGHVINLGIDVISAEVCGSGFPAAIRRLKISDPQLCWWSLIFTNSFALCLGGHFSGLSGLGFTKKY